MKRVIKIDNQYGTKDKFILQEEYNGFGLYKEQTPNGLFVHNSWLISNNSTEELAIKSHNRISKEEALSLIDNHIETGKFGVDAVMFYGTFHMKNGGMPI